MDFEIDIPTLQNITYIISSVLFITGIKMLGKESTAVKGNFLSAVAMFIAVGITCIGLVNPIVLFSGILLGAIIGSFIALKVKMTSIPEMVALFNGFGGLATFLIAWSEFNNGPDSFFQLALVMFTLAIGGITFTGSLIAYGKLSEKINIAKTSIITKIFTTIFYISLAFLLYSVFITPLLVPTFEFFTVLLVLVLLGGIGFVLPIGGGDMPVVISLLNSFSGIAAAFAGLLLFNNVLIVAGSLVGASGLILTVIMAKAMNRSISNILFVGYASSSPINSSEEQGEIN
ncbi:MAG: NAD(P)(+) transhydrogenase (Re/Si-specific) subunit beta, partial [SAR86 cluster bacterium]|nr:NAD(P)(+) transhydrogenase (Re/Si-specific) subunit beta [SAR86 cluster bacterium]